MPGHALVENNTGTSEAGATTQPERILTGSARTPVDASTAAALIESRTSIDRRWRMS
jgi:hypothetical protein